MKNDEKCKILKNIKINESHYDLRRNNLRSTNPYTKAKFFNIRL